MVTGALFLMLILMASLLAALLAAAPTATTVQAPIARSQTADLRKRPRVKDLEGSPSGRWRRS